jgi:hypothetical protein
MTSSSTARRPSRRLQVQVLNIQPLGTETLAGSKRVFDFYTLSYTRLPDSFGRGFIHQTRLSVERGSGRTPTVELRELLKAATGIKTIEITGVTQ